MKKFLCLAITAVFLLCMLFAGCSGNSEYTEKPDDISFVSSIQVNAQDTKVLPTGKSVVVTYLSWHNETTLKPLLDAFHEKHPNIKIDLRFSPPIHDYVEKAKVLFLAGEIPDLFVTCAENKTEVIENGYAMDISSLPIFKRMGKAFRDAYSKDGKIFAFAPDAWISGIFYNKKLFKSVGVTVPNSYDEFLDVMEKLKNAGIRPITFSTNNLYDIPQALFITETIHNIPDYDVQVNEGRSTYAEGWTVPFQMWYKDFVQSGYVTGDMLEMTNQQVIDEFVAEKTAMMIGGPWNVKIITDENPDIEFDMMPFVGTEPGAKCNVGAVGVGFSIGATSKKREHAMKYLEFLTSDEGLLLLQQINNTILGVEGLEYELHPVFEKYKAQVMKGDFYLPAVVWKYSEPMGKEIVRGSQDILAGIARPEEIPVRMDKKRMELEQRQKHSK